jgi:hypothetical protein
MAAAGVEFPGTQPGQDGLDQAGTPVWVLFGGAGQLVAAG